MQLFDTKDAFDAYQHGTREREDQGGAVAARARKVQTEYKAHARQMDARIATAQNAPLATAVHPDPLADAWSYQGSSVRSLW